MSAEYDLLDCFIRNGDTLELRQLYEMSGYSHNWAYKILRRLVLSGHIVKRAHGMYKITESGRIVHALMSAKFRVNKLKRSIDKREKV